ncbi:8295_t:CDS:2, partial [Paraglomus occultum]
VLMMDELDLLVTKNQRVMYNLFNWPSLPNSRLVVIAVANTMDLPERILTNRVSSRLGLNRVNFQPYAFQQLMIVVQSRLKGMGVFNKDAIEYAARKVSAVSGDARRALEICRRAVEIIESKKTLPEHSKSNAQVTINIIEQVVKEMSSSPTIAFVSNASIHQKIFLWSLLQRTRVTGLAEVELGE